MAARFRSSWAAVAILLLGAELQAYASLAQDDVPARLNNQPPCKECRFKTSPRSG